MRLTLEDRAHAIATAAAFPHKDSDGDAYEGMNYREWLIGQALAGICASNALPAPALLTENQVSVEVFRAAEALKHADALIRALAEED